MKPMAEKQSEPDPELPELPVETAELEEMNVLEDMNGMEDIQGTDEVDEMDGMEDIEGMDEVEDMDAEVPTSSMLEDVKKTEMTLEGVAPVEDEKTNEGAEMESELEATEKFSSSSSSSSPTRSSATRSPGSSS